MIPTTRTFVIVALLCKLTAAAVEDDVLAAAENSDKTLAKLYTVLLNVALPPTSQEPTGDEPINQRLVLLLPGKVLNYYDYFPGNAYEASLENPDHDGQQVIIPPRVMENMFALADVIPGVYPLRGQETGESMAIIYENILNQMEVKGFTDKTETEKERYLIAINYLAEEIADPLDVTQNVTRFQLYRRSQDLYNDRRLEMEDTIDAKRRELPGIEFERWFQRNYPSLNSKVEGAYTEWLIFGEKEIVELYKSFLDVESPGIDLEEARMALRASGLTALDRTRTIYPVNFVPSNWYRYLVNVTKVDEARTNEDGFSRDELLAAIGELEASKRVLEALKLSEPSDELRENLTALQNMLDSSNTALSEYANDTEQLRQRCLSSRIKAKATGESGISDECLEYETATSTATSKITSNSELYQCVSDLDFQINGVAEIRASIESSIAKIDQDITSLQQKLLLAGSKFSTLAQHAADSQEQLDSRWLQFEVNSEKTEFQTSSSQKQFSTAASFKASGFFWSVRASSSYSRSESKFQRDMNSAQVNIKGELLRVIVQRPWFRPSLFKSTHFQIRVDKTAKVSPGPKTDENEHINDITSNTYLLPEYVTGLLLSRNVTLDFKVDSASTSARAVSVGHSASVSGRYGPWRASFSYNYGKRERSFRTESTSDGLRITIPGAQVIGYFTQVTPKFPK